MAAAEVILKKAETGDLSGTLVPVRAAGARWAKGKHQLLCGGRAHVSHKARRALNKPTPDLENTQEYKNLQAAQYAYVKASQTMLAKGGEAQTWTVDNVQSEIAVLLATAGETEEAMARLSTAYDEVFTLRNQERLAKERGRKTATKEAQKVTCS